MRKLLIVSPSFPPANGADMHRVRMSLPYYAEFGWDPVVLTVDPRYLPLVNDSMLLKTIPAAAHVVHVPALPVRWTRRVGIGDVAYRAFGTLYAAGSRILREERPSLVYFSTTAFPVLALGRMWKRRYGIPFVVDMQDPWVPDYRPATRRSAGWKDRVVASMHRSMEPWVMPAADGLIAVSHEYIRTLHSRYPQLRSRPHLTLPFGGAARDFDVLSSYPQPNRFFRRDPGKIHGVYVGRGGSDMQPALRILFGALQVGLRKRPDVFSKVQLHFVGTSYASDQRAVHTVLPSAREFGVAAQVQEDCSRVPYFEGLQLLRDADFLVTIGSDDPQYTASKIFPYILARKPLFGIFHNESSVCSIVGNTHSGSIVPFDPAQPAAEYYGAACKVWSELLERLPFIPETDWAAFEQFDAPEMTRKQCLLFDQVLAHPSEAAGDKLHLAIPA